MMMLMQGAVEQGFIYALVALALYLSYRILDIADLTTDGSFVLGCAVSATCATQGHPALGLLADGGGHGGGVCDRISAHPHEGTGHWAFAFPTP